MLLVFLLNVNASSGLHVTRLSTEHLENPIGISFTQPRFSWNIIADRSGIVQTAYQIRITSNGKEHWNSGKIISNQSHLIQYEGPSILDRTRYQWQVKVWDNYGNESAFSEEAFFETGFFKSSNWKSEWITTALEEQPREKNPVQYYRREIALKGEVKRARMYVSAHGLYKAFINGKKVGDQEFTPGWTSYKKRLQYQVYDISNAFVTGSNCLSVMLAEGWHRGRINYRGKDDPFKNQLSLLLQIEVEYENGRKQIFGTDKKWRASSGGLLESTIYDGEVFHVSEEPIAWKSTGFDDKEWLPCQETDEGKDHLVASHSPSVKVQERLQPTETVNKPGEYVLYDFGQNMTGRIAIEMILNGAAEVLIEHGEDIDAEGNLYTDNLRDAMARVVFKADAPGVYSYIPQFTFMGFRYVRIKGLSIDQVKSIRAEVIHSDLELTGSFKCSSEEVNRLYQNIVWSQKGNFLDVPTDCPQRDERMGWTGDAQVFAKTAAYNMNVAAFFSKWLADVEADQREDGAIPWVIPNVFTKKKPPATGWADAAVIVPWKMYEVYGDAKILEAQYASMKAWVDFMVANAEEGLWKGERHFGDWLSYVAKKQPQVQSAVTENDLLAAIYYQYSMQLLVRSAQVLERGEDEENYAHLLEEANAAFLMEFITANGRLVSGTQTAYTLVLAYDLLPEELREGAVRRLVENIRGYGHLTTGFLGVSELNEVLSSNGYEALAYELLFRKEYPSWLYPVEQGATTIWERWDGKREDGSFQEAYLNSFNHYAYGAIGEWMIERMAGIQPLESSVGFKKFNIAPQISDSLSYVEASYKCNYGWIHSGWELDGHKGLKMLVEIPANTQAEVYCPKGYQIVRVASKEFGTFTPMSFFMEIGEKLSLGSGVYSLVLEKVPSE